MKSNTNSKAAKAAKIAKVQAEFDADFNARKAALRAAKATSTIIALPAEAAEARARAGHTRLLVALP